jgi:hypothetical protein
VDICQPIQVETDCLGLATGIQAGGGDRARWGGISSVLPAYKIDYVRREANEVTYRLAYRGLLRKEWAVMICLMM